MSFFLAIMRILVMIMNRYKQDIVNQILKRSGFKKLNPVQQKAQKADLLLGVSQVIAAPTASGKTLIAEIAALNVISQGKKVVYLVPLRALASEKYGTFKKKYSSLGIKVALSIGDFDNSDPWLSGYDLIVCTCEKFDSLLRHGMSWFSDIGLVVVDEIHLLNSPDRGPTLEIILTRIKRFISPEIIALSATISNYKELAGWLSAKAIKSNFRPVKLYKGVFLDKEINFKPKKKLKLSSAGLPALIEHTLRQKKQALLFVSTRRSAEAAAEQLGKTVKKELKTKEKTHLSNLAEKVKKFLERPTKQCKRLAKCVETGIAFHHAGLIRVQRKLIEDNFKAGKIKVIVATPTLAWGVNLPAFRVIIRDLKRFNMLHGMSWMPILEIQQMEGRAGRPQYDASGEAILFAKNKQEAQFAWKNYILGKPERITSQLGFLSVLRTHVLALIAGNVVTSSKELVDFFSQTFYVYQTKNLLSLEGKLEEILDQLINFGFVYKEKTQEDERLLATRIGKRVVELYIDPESAYYLIESLEKVQAKRAMSDFGWFHIAIRCLEMSPFLSIKKKDWEWLEKILVREEPWLLESPPAPYELEYDEFLQGIKTAQLFYEWIDERSEDALLNKFGVTPGELRIRLEKMDWLLYSALELGKLLRGFEWKAELKRLRMRLLHGVREELLPLIKLKGIGRVRARILYDSGLKRLADLEAIPLFELRKIIGPKIAQDIKSSLNKIKLNKNK